MIIELGKTYLDKISGEKATVVGFRYMGDKVFVEHTYYGGVNSYEVDSEQFRKEFKEKVYQNNPTYSFKGLSTAINSAPMMEEETSRKRSINSDILKLIEAGYEFSSFWGDTVDGRSINVDLNEEE